MGHDRRSNRGVWLQRKITLTTTDGKHIDVSGKAENFASDMKEKGSVVFDGMMAKGTDVVNNVKEKAPIVANNVASEVAGTMTKSRTRQRINTMNSRQKKKRARRKRTTTMRSGRNSAKR